MHAVTGPEADLTRALVERGGLYEFIRIFWEIADPAHPFQDNWHIGAIAEHCAAVSRREIRNLVINVPPGSGKSTLVSVLWPAWHWTWNPAHSWMFASFDGQLVQRDAGRNLDVIQSPEYRGAWPAFNLGGDIKALGCYTNAHGGRRYSTSVAGRGTGWHSDTQVCDDPNKALDCRSPLALEKSIQWWAGTMSSRACDPETFCRVVIMQRLADTDLSGYLLREMGYSHLMIPMRYDPIAFADGGWDKGSELGGAQAFDPRTEPGELLWPDRIDEDTCAAAEKQLGTPQNVSAQHQQNPIPDKGGIIEKDWILHWTILPKRLRLIQSWDLGFKGKEQSHSRVVGQLWGEAGGSYFLIDEVSGTWNYPETKRQFLAAQDRTAEGFRWRDATAKCIEDKANGSAIIAELTEGIANEGKMIRIPGVIAVCPTDDKATRLIFHSDRFRCGMVFVPPMDRPWVAGFVAEVVAFPRGQHDDRVDTSTQALDYLTGPVAAYTEALKQIQGQHD